jgi:predicted TIM-barrel fold metal-dependent hydrolase
MPVIDVDSHYEAFHLGDPLEANPLREFVEYFPKFEDLVLWGPAGDLWRETPEKDRAGLVGVIPFLSSLRGEVEPATSPMMMAAATPDPAATNVDARVAWMDRIGIDFALVNHGGGYAGIALGARDYVDSVDVRHAMLRRCNDFLGDWITGHTDRLGAVSIVDTDDVAWSITELERMRARGSRGVFLSAAPFGGISPAHPDNDRFWHAVESLGMVGVIHIGETPAYFGGGWADAGWLEAGGAGVGGYLRFANSARIEAAQKFISALVFGGVFARCPGVTIVLEELWAAWMPSFVARFEQLRAAGDSLGSWDSPLSPHDYVRKNVKLTPLPGLGDNGMSVIDELADMLVFSSDYPHSEGNLEPMAAYGGAIEDLKPDLRQSFLGGTMEECFARTGDPLPLPN